MWSLHASQAWLACLFAVVVNGPPGSCLSFLFLGILLCRQRGQFCCLVRIAFIHGER